VLVTAVAALLQKAPLRDVERCGWGARVFVDDRINHGLGEETDRFDRRANICRDNPLATFRESKGKGDPSLARSPENSRGRFYLRAESALKRLYARRTDNYSCRIALRFCGTPAVLSNVRFAELPVRIKSNQI